MTLLPGILQLGLAWLAWLILTGAVTYAGFAWDKAMARKGRRRVPERRLLWLCALGGAWGGKLAQRRLRHKTRKQPFARRLDVLALAHLAAILLAMGYLLARRAPWACAWC